LTLKLLTPILVQTAKTSSPGSVRVIWASSAAAELQAPKSGVDFTNLDYKQDNSAHMKYAVSKAGNILHSQQFTTFHRNDGTVSVSLNPGNLRTELQRYVLQPIK
ncbi:hypothetical protein K432DRAFT_307378, partial [Lepidopterella palustris CBS 459.81]